MTGQAKSEISSCCLCQVSLLFKNSKTLKNWKTKARARNISNVYRYMGPKSYPLHLNHQSEGVELQRGIPTSNRVHYQPQTSGKGFSLNLQTVLSLGMTRASLAAALPIENILIVAYPPYPEQGFFFSRNIGQVTPKMIYFYYLKKQFLAQSIQKIFYLILKKDALTPNCQVCLHTMCDCYKLSEAIQKHHFQLLRLLHQLDDQFEHLIDQMFKVIIELV